MIVHPLDVVAETCPVCGKQPMIVDVDRDPGTRAWLLCIADTGDDCCVGTKDLPEGWTVEWT